MCPNVSLQDFIGPNASLRDLIRFYRSQSVLMSLSGSLCVLMGSYRS